MTVQKLWKNQKISNPNLPKTTLIEGDMYTTHWIFGSPAHQRHKGHRRLGKSGESSGGTAVAAESPFFTVWKSSRELASAFFRTHKVYIAALTKTPLKKKKLQPNPYKILPVVLIAGGRSSHKPHSRRTKGWRGDTPSLQLEANLLPNDGTSQFLIASKTTHQTHRQAL